ncbi:MAG: FxsA family protein [Beijerinckiaceae bacterium]
MRRYPLLTILLIVTAWIAVEITVFNLVAGWTGGLMAFLLFILKSVLGFSFVGQLIKRKLMNMGGVRVASVDPSVLRNAPLKVVGAVLLVIPGFLAGIIGLALLTPSIQTLLGARRKRAMQNPQEIDLPSNDWREMPDEPVKRIRRRKKPDLS